LPRLLNDLQGAADVPLLVAADMERGLAFRVRHGVVPLPFAMAIGATRSEEAARFAGEVAAREGRALGVHWAFAPVADVNNNPSNPVINIRSYGEDPELVARLVTAFVRGAPAPRPPPPPHPSPAPRYPRPRISRDRATPRRTRPCSFPAWGATAGG